MITTWHPVGYTSGRRLGRSAPSGEYGGQLPLTRKRCGRSGNGKYTGAIRSFARERAAILDTNVARVLFRAPSGAGDPKSHDEVPVKVSAALVPNMYVFDQPALMDLGAMVCVARNPKASSARWRKEPSTRYIVIEDEMD
jgi:adenine-specific DNA glycosylase